MIQGKVLVTGATANTGRAMVGSNNIARPSFDQASHDLLKLFSASRSISADKSGSVTILDIVTAPIIVETATSALRLASEGLALPNCPAMISTSFRKPSVATARVLSSLRPSSLPIADSGHAAPGLSR
jgi:hypothetical protein